MAGEVYKKSKISLCRTKMHVGCFENIKQNWVPIVLNLLALIGIAIHGIVYYSKLPASVVYHYDAYGNPDRSTSTKNFIALYWFATLLSTVLMFVLSTIFALNCCATACTSPEEASYSPLGRRYLRLVVSGWALWLNLSVLALIFTIFAILLQNALKAFDRATTFGVYMPFFIYCALLVILIYWMLSNIQGAKRLMYTGYFAEETHDPKIESHPDENNGNSEEMK